MNQQLKVLSTIQLIMLFIFSGCTYLGEINANKKAIADIDQKLDRSLAEYNNEFDKIKREIQSVKGSLEENSYHTKKTISELQTKIDRLLTLSSENRKQISLIGKQPASSQTNTMQTDAPPQTSTSDEQRYYDMAYNDYKKGLHKKARQAFEIFLKNYPESSSADNALYWIGNCYFKEKSFERAISTFDDVIKKFPGGNKVPDAYYLQALSFCEIKDPLGAQIILEALIQQYPASNAASLAKKKHAELQAATHP